MPEQVLENTNIRWLDLDHPDVPAALRERICEKLAQRCSPSLFAVARHARVLTVSDVLRVVGIDPRDLIKSLALIAGEDTMLLACIDGGARLDVRAVRSLVGGRPVRFANATEVLAFGAPVGSLSPILANMPLLFDGALLQLARYVYIGSGDPEWSVRVHSNALLMLGRAVIADLSKE